MTDNHNSNSSISTARTSAISFESSEFLCSQELAAIIDDGANNTDESLAGDMPSLAIRRVQEKLVKKHIKAGTIRKINIPPRGDESAGRRLTRTILSFSKNFLRLHVQHKHVHVPQMEISPTDGDITHSSKESFRGGRRNSARNVAA